MTHQLSHVISGPSLVISLHFSSLGLPLSPALSKHHWLHSLINDFLAVKVHCVIPKPKQQLVMKTCALCDNGQKSGTHRPQQILPGDTRGINGALCSRCHGSPNASPAPVGARCFTHKSRVGNVKEHLCSRVSALWRASSGFLVGNSRGEQMGCAFWWMSKGKAAAERGILNVGATPVTWVWR